MIAIPNFGGHGGRLNDPLVPPGSGCGVKAALGHI
jgi:hypothetical protein